MKLEGTVVNGTIMLDGGTALPEGTRVRIELEEVFEYPHPMAPYDREKEIALLRQSIVAMEAGEKGKSVEEVFAAIDRELDRQANGEG